MTMPSGSTSRPVASMIHSAMPKSLPKAAILPSWMPTSQAKVSAAVTTVPPRMMVSSSIVRSSLFAFPMFDDRGKRFHKSYGRFGIGASKAPGNRFAELEHGEGFRLPHRGRDGIDHRHWNAIADLV